MEQLEIFVLKGITVLLVRTRQLHVLLVHTAMLFREQRLEIALLVMQVVTVMGLGLSLLIFSALKGITATLVAPLLILESTAALLDISVQLEALLKLAVQVESTSPLLFKEVAYPALNATTVTLQQ